MLSYSKDMINRNELRKEAKERIGRVDRMAESAVILERLMSLSAYREAETILAFCPLPDEPDITPILDDRRILLPYIEGDAMHFSSSRAFHRARLGFMEPEHIEAEYGTALMLVPLLGYNRRLYRLGRGGGFYDRYIRENGSRLVTAGLAFSVSFFPDFQEEEHDARLSSIITGGERTPVI